GVITGPGPHMEDLLPLLHIERRKINCVKNGLPVVDSPFRCKTRSEEHTSELQSLAYLVCRLLLEKKKTAHILGLLYSQPFNPPSVNFYLRRLSNLLFFHFTDTTPTDFYTLSLHDALPICGVITGPGPHMEDLLPLLHIERRKINCVKNGLPVVDSPFRCKT